jgi:hypothetical protein
MVGKNVSLSYFLCLMVNELFLIVFWTSFGFLLQSKRRHLHNLEHSPKNTNIYSINSSIKDKLGNINMIGVRKMYVQNYWVELGQDRTR